MPPVYVAEFISFYVETRCNDDQLLIIGTPLSLNQAELQRQAVRGLLDTISTNLESLPAEEYSTKDIVVVGLERSRASPWFCRAVILDWQFCPGSVKFSVLLVDECLNNIVVFPNQLYSCPKHLLNIPTVIQQYILADVLPKANVWSLGTVQYLHNKLVNRIVSAIIIVGDGKYGYISPLEPGEIEFPLVCRLILEQHALPAAEFPGLVKYFVDKLSKEIPGIWEALKPSERCTKSVDHSTMSGTYQAMPLPTSHYEDCYISHCVVGPWKFYLQFKHQRESYHKLKRRLALHADSDRLVRSTCAIGGNVLCNIEGWNDERYQRGLVTGETLVDEVPVYLVDKGLTLKLRKNSMWTLPQELLDTPICMFKCALEGLPNAVDSEMTNSFVEIIESYPLKAMIVKLDDVKVVKVSLFAGNQDVKIMITSAFRKQAIIKECSVFISSICEESALIYLQMSSEIEKLEELQGKLQEVCMSSRRIDHPKIGITCAAEFEDGYFYRALVTDVNDCAKVRYVDYGNSGIVPFAKLREIPVDLIVKLPAQAIPCSLNQLSPQCIKTEYITRCFGPIGEREAIVNVVCVKEMKIGSEICQVAVVDIMALDTGLSLNKTLYGVMKSNLEKQVDPITKGQDKIGGLDSGRLVERSVVPIDTTQQRCTPAKLPEVEVLPGTFLMVRLSFVGKVSFYVTLREKDDDVKAIRSALVEVCKNTQRKNVERALKGLMVAVLDSSDNYWHRGLITGCVGQLIEVYLIDSGKDIVVEKKMLLRLPDNPSVLILPAQALRCTLSGGVLTPSWLESLKNDVGTLVLMMFEKYQDGFWEVKMYSEKLSPGDKSRDLNSSSKGNLNKVNVKSVEMPTTSPKSYEESKASPKKIEEIAISSKSTTIRNKGCVASLLQKSSSNVKDQWLDKDSFGGEKVISPTYGNENVNETTSSNWSHPSQCSSGPIRAKNYRYHSSPSQEPQRNNFSRFDKPVHNSRNDQGYRSRQDNSGDDQSFLRKPMELGYKDKPKSPLQDSWRVGNSGNGSHESQHKKTYDINRNYVATNTVERRFQNQSRVSPEKASRLEDDWRTPKKVDFKDDAFDIRGQKEKIRSFPQGLDRSNQVFSAIISHAESDESLWIQPLDELSSLDKLMEDINEGQGFSLVQLKSNPEVNFSCLSRYAEDGRFYRAVIREVNVANNFAVVHYVDYGNCSTVQLEELRVVPQGYLEIPCKALHCFFSQDIIENKLDNLHKKIEEIFCEELEVCLKRDLHDHSRHVIGKCSVGVRDILSEIFQENKAHSGTDDNTAHSGADGGSSRDLPLPDITKILEMFVDSNTEVTAYISFVGNGCLWIQLSDNFESLQDMMEKLNRYANGDKKVIPSSPPCINKPYICQYSEDERYYRVIVREVSSTNDVLVHYVDYGNSDHITQSSLYTIPSEFMSLPKQALCCYFNRSIKCVWSQRAQQYLEELQDQELKISLKQETVDGKVEYTLSKGCLKDVDVLEHIISLTSIRNEEERMNMVKDEIKTKQCIPQASLPLGNSFSVYFCHVEKGSLWVQLTEQYSALEELMKNLNNSQLNLPSCFPSVGCFCIGRYSADGRFYRAIVKEQDPDKLGGIVQYIDYGNCDHVKLEDLHDIPDNFLDLPRQASECSFRKEVMGQWSKVLQQSVEDLLNLEGTVSFNEKIKDVNILSVCSVDGRDILAELDSAITRDPKSHGDCNTIPENSITYGVAFSAIISFMDEKSFWIQTSDEAEALEDLMQKLNEDSLTSLSKYPVGCFCIAKYSEDDRYYRALLLKINDDQSSYFVHFIDFGNKEWIDIENFRAPPIYFWNLPRQAVQCYLNENVEALKVIAEYVDEYVEVVLSSEEEKNGVSRNVVTSCTHAKVDIMSKIKDLSQGKQEISCDVKVYSESAEYAPRQSNEDSTPCLNLQVPVVKCGESFNAIVSHVEGDGTLWIQDRDHLSSLDEMMTCLNDLNKEDLVALSDTPIVGSLCLGTYVDERLYRVTVKEILEDELSALVHYVDYGNEDMLEIKNLYKITKEFCNLSSQAVHCYFSQEIRNHWAECHQARMEELEEVVVIVSSNPDSERVFILKELIAENVDIVLEIKKDLNKTTDLCGDQILSDPISTKSEAQLLTNPNDLPHADDGDKVQISHTISEVSENTQSGKNDTDLSRGKQKGSCDVEVCSVSAEYNQSNEESTPCCLSLQPPVVKCGESFTAIVSHVEGDGTLWIQDRDHLSSLDEMMTCLNDLNKNDLVALSDTPIVGSLCLGTYVDERLYRVTVKEILEDELSALVHYVDYGNEDMLEIKNLYKITKEFCNLSSQAVHCYFSQEIRNHWAECHQARMEELEEVVVVVSSDPDSERVFVLKELITENIDIVLEFKKDLKTTDLCGDQILSDPISTKESEAQLLTNPNDLSKADDGEETKISYAISEVCENTQDRHNFVSSTEEILDAKEMNEPENEDLEASPPRTGVISNSDSDTNISVSMHSLIPTIEITENNEESIFTKEEPLTQGNKTHLENSVHGTELCALPKSQLKYDESFKAFVSHCEGDGSLWLQSMSSMNSLDELMENLNHLEGQDLESLNSEPDNGRLCACCYEEDGRFYRCVIKEYDMDQDVATIQFIDYGNQGSMKLKELRNLPDRFLTLPIQAIQCYVNKDIRQCWSQDLQNIVEHLEVVVVNVVKDSEDGCLVIKELYFEDRDLLFELNEILVNSDLAECVVGASLPKSDDCMPNITEVYADTGKVLDESLESDMQKTVLNVEMSCLSQMEGAVDDMFNASEIKSTDKFLEASEGHPEDKLAIFQMEGRSNAEFIPTNSEVKEISVEGEVVISQIYQVSSNRRIHLPGEMVNATDVDGKEDCCKTLPESVDEEVSSKGRGAEESSEENLAGDLSVKKGAEESNEKKEAEEQIEEKIDEMDKVTRDEKSVEENRTCEDKGAYAFSEDVGVNENDENKADICSEERGPEESGDERGLEESGNERGLEESGNERGPEELSEERGPEELGEERGPEELGEERGPEESDGERGPNKSGEDRGSKESDGERGPKESSDERGLKVSVEERGPKVSGEERGPKVSGEESGLKESGEERGPKESGEERGPKESGEERGPKESGEERGPKESGEERGPKVSGEERGPMESGEERAPEESGEERAPEESGEERAPEESGEERAPEESGEERAPEESGEERDPEESGENRGPEELSEESGPNESGEEQGPEESGGKRGPGLLDKERQPKESGEERLLDEREPDEFDEEGVPCESDKECVPDKLNEEPVPEKFDEEPVPEKFDEEPAPEKFDEEQVPEKFDEKQVPDKFDEEQVPDKFDKEQVLDESNEKQVSDEEQVPDESDEVQVPDESDEEQVPCESDEEQVPCESDEEQVPCESDEEQVPNEADEEQVPNEADEEQVPNEADEEQVPNEADEEQIPNEADEEQVPHEADEEQVPYEADEEQVPYEADKEQVPYEADKEQVPYEADKEQLPYEADKEQVPYEADKEQVPYEADKEQVPYEADKEQVPYEADKEQVPNEADKEQVPNEADKEQVPNEADKEQVPNEADKEQVPNEADKEQVPNEADKEQVPNEADKEQVPNEADKEQVPNEADKEQVPNEADKEQVPNEADKEQVPDEAEEERVPDESEEERVPDESEEERVPDESEEERVPDESEEERVPDESEEERVPDESEEERVPDESEEERVPDESEEERVPDESEEERVPDESEEERVPDESEEERVPDESEEERVPDESEEERVPDESEEERVPDESEEERVPDESDREGVPDESDREGVPDEFDKEQVTDKEGRPDAMCKESRSDALCKVREPTEFNEENVFHKSSEKKLADDLIEEKVADEWSEVRGPGRSSEEKINNREFESCKEKGEFESCKEKGEFESCKEKGEFESCKETDEFESCEEKGEFESCKKKEEFESCKGKRDYESGEEKEIDKSREEEEPSSKNPSLDKKLNLNYVMPSDAVEDVKRGENDTQIDTKVADNLQMDDLTSIEKVEFPSIEKAPAVSQTENSVLMEKVEYISIGETTHSHTEGQGQIKKFEYFQSNLTDIIIQTDPICGKGISLFDDRHEEVVKSEEPEHGRKMVEVTTFGDPQDGQELQELMNENQGSFSEICEDPATPVRDDIQSMQAILPLGLRGTTKMKEQVVKNGITVYITCLKNNGNLLLQPEGDLERRANMQLKIKEVIDSLEEPMDIYLGMACIAKSPNNDLWQRGIVRSVQKDVHIYFVDFGVSECVDMKNIRPIPINFLESPCCLSCQVQLREETDIQKHVEPYIGKPLNLSILDDKETSQTLSFSYLGEDILRKFSFLLYKQEYTQTDECTYQVTESAAAGKVTKHVRFLHSIKEDEEENDATIIQQYKASIISIEERPFSIWVLKEEDFDISLFIQNSLEKPGQCFELIKSPEVGQLCFSVLKKNKHRAKVISFDSCTASVHYIDQGKYGRVSRKELWKLPDELIDIHPLASQVFLPITISKGMESVSVIAIAEVALSAICLCVDIKEKMGRKIKTYIFSKIVGDLGNYLVNENLASPMKFTSHVKSQLRYICENYW